jgi:hypothetical protein
LLKVGFTFYYTKLVQEQLCRQIIPTSGGHMEKYGGERGNLAAIKFAQ